jgi:TRAP-type C4-dicarboxylate transport system permease small subunit
VRVLTGAALVLLVGVVLAAVAVRYFGIFAGSLHWADELARFTTIWLVMLGSVVALDRGAHVAVDLLPAALPAGLGRALRVIAALLSAAFLVTLAWQGLALSGRTMRQVSPALGLPMGYVYLAVPVGAAVMALQALVAALGGSGGGAGGVPAGSAGHASPGPAGGGPAGSAGRRRPGPVGGAPTSVAGREAASPVRGGRPARTSGTRPEATRPAGPAMRPARA